MRLGAAAPARGGVEAHVAAGAAAAAAETARTRGYLHSDVDVSGAVDARSWRHSAPQHGLGHDFRLRRRGGFVSYFGFGFDFGSGLYSNCLLQHESKYHNV